MTFWPLTNSDLPTNQTFHQFHDLYTDLDIHWIMSGFRGAFATGVASQQETLTLPDTWFRPPFWDLLMLQLLRPNSSYLPCLYSTFHLGYPLVLSRFYLWPLCLVWLLVCCLYKEVYLQIFKCVSFWLFGWCGEWEYGPVNQVNHTSWVSVVTPTDRPESVRNCCLIELFWRCLCCHFAFLTFPLV